MPALATITSRRPKRRSAASTISGQVFLESHVLVEKDGLAAGIADLVHHRLAAGVVQVGHHHLGAFTRQGCGACGANPGCAAGDDSDLALDLPHSVLPSLLYSAGRPALTAMTSRPV
jgi:hypothetical protein